MRMNLGICAACAALCVLVGSNTAVAAQRTDPKANSPAGVIYQIPFDNARSEAAPVPVGHHDSGGGSGGSGGGGSAGGSATGGGGSESSGAASGPAGAASIAHSSPSAKGTASSTAASSSNAPGASASDPSSIHSDNGFGSSGVPGIDPAAALTGAGTQTASGPDSAVPIYLLLVLLAAVAVAAGVASTHRARRHQG